MRHRPTLRAVAAATLLLAGAAVAAPAATPATAGPPGAAPAAADCPQPRRTEPAPVSYARLLNPLPRTAANVERGRQLYLHAEPQSCASCHGSDGRGRGTGAAGLVPPPRDFTCAATMNTLADGQLYWVIENGSGPFHRPSRQGAQQIGRPGRGEPPRTGMLAYGRHLTDTEIWQIVTYLRTLPSAPQTKATTP